MKKVKIDLLKGDITERDTDAIINTANNLLILGSGLSGAIKAKGGNKIAEECSRHGAVNIGDAVITTAGDLKSKYIIHAALMEYDSPIKDENISLSLLSSLKVANKRSLKSISIPDMSVGITRFPPEKCAKILFTVINNFIKEENKTIELIEIVLWDIETLHIYKNIYKVFFKQDD
jgi:O-acetyl-ADP-ribose deacetylase (regulator of RNase III)